LRVAVDAKKDHVGSEHVLFGLEMIPDAEIQRIFTELGIDIGQLIALTSVYAENDPNSPETIDLFTPAILEAFAQANIERQARGASEIEPADLILGMLSVKVGMGFILLFMAQNGEQPALETTDEAKSDMLTAVRNILAG